MTGKEVRLGKVFGVEIALDYSWFWIFLLVMYSFSANFLPALKPEQDILVYIFYGLIGSLLFFLSIILHELSHTLVARRNHLPIDKITLFIFGGASNLNEEPKSPSVEFKMAVAGPICSLVIAGIIIGLNRLVPFDTNNLFLSLLRVIGAINLGLGIFNLLPGFPLDGGRILRSIVWAQTRNLLKATRVAAIFGKIVAVGLGLIGVFEILIGGLLGGFWMILIGYFLYQMASAGYNQTLISLILSKTLVVEVMSPKANLIDKEITVAKLINQIATEQKEIYLVKNGDVVVGVIKSDDLSLTPKDKWGQKIIELMTPISRLAKVRPMQKVSDALAILNDSQNGIVAVVQGEQIVGTLTERNLRYYLLRHMPKNKRTDSSK